MFKKIVCFLVVLFLVTACNDSWDSIKRGITGEKQISTDEFLVEKKDPLSLPPDFEDLPTPSSSASEEEINEISNFEKSLTTSSSENDEQTLSTDPEKSILRKIQKQ